MRLLLDTRALIWWLAGDEALSLRAREAIADEGNTVAVSAASAMEIATKHRIGKLPHAALLHLVHWHPHTGGDHPHAALLHLPHMHALGVLLGK